jgi:hypothetical protein
MATTQLYDWALVFKNITQVNNNQPFGMLQGSLCNQLTGFMIIPI